MAEYEPRTKLATDGFSVGIGILGSMLKNILHGNCFLDPKIESRRDKTYPSLVRLRRGLRPIDRLPLSPPLPHAYLRGIDRKDPGLVFELGDLTSLPRDNGHGLPQASSQIDPGTTRTNEEVATDPQMMGLAARWEKVLKDKKFVLPNGSEIRVEQFLRGSRSATT